MVYRLQIITQYQFQVVPGSSRTLNVAVISVHFILYCIVVLYYSTNDDL